MVATASVSPILQHKYQGSYEWWQLPLFHQHCNTNIKAVMNGGNCLCFINTATQIPRQLCMVATASVSTTLQHKYQGSYEWWQLPLFHQHCNTNIKAVMNGGNCLCFINTATQIPRQLCMVATASVSTTLQHKYQGSYEWWQLPLFHQHCNTNIKAAMNGGNCLCFTNTATQISRQL